MTSLNSDQWIKPVPARTGVVGIGLLCRVRVRTVVNHLAQALSESPVKSLLTATCMALVWYGLYWLFRAVFAYLQQSALEAAVAIPMVFEFFFVAMLVMLVVSNAILAYVSLFAVDEAVYLLAAPVPPRAYVSLKYAETLVFSSWALVLLGLPLMVAMADISDEPWLYYPFFVAFFLAFVPIPGAIGLVVAWTAARFFGRDARRRLIVLGGIALAAVVVWSVQSVQVNEAQPSLWLTEFLGRLKFLQAAILPSRWVSKGVEAALNYDVGTALTYLGVTVSNALFLSMLGVEIVASRFSVAFDRALTLRGGGRRGCQEPLGGFAGVVFFYLPRQMRLIAIKDLRMFLRDPLQWTQLVVLFGLMCLYLVNLPRFSGAAPLQGWGMIIPFLNFGAISFILATFTSRFVFPLVSLEGHQFWLIGLLPLSIARLLLAKFAFSMTVAVAVAVGTTILAAIMLSMPPDWALLQIGVTIAVCTGLCGLAIGIGARLPMFGQKNAARIANGFGGTINLIASVSLVLLMLTGMAWIGVRIRIVDGFSGPVDATSLLIAAGVATWGLACGVISLWLGARHLRRAEV